MKKLLLILMATILLGVGCYSTQTSPSEISNFSNTSTASHFKIISIEKNQTVFDENDVESYNSSSHTFNLHSEATERIRSNFALGSPQPILLSIGTSTLFNAKLGTKNLLACDGSKECLGPIFIDITLSNKAQIIFDSKKEENNKKLEEIKKYFAS